MKNIDVSAKRCKSDVQKLARKRWALLSEALLSKKKREKIIDFELNYFNIYVVVPLPNTSAKNMKWYQYGLTINEKIINVKVCHYARNFTIEDLTGFNNTGNVKVWPSEELLAYICLKHGQFFDNKSVLEVGGGMSCLAGILLSHFTKCSMVHVTDGNALSVENVLEIIKANPPAKCPLTCDVLIWNDFAQHCHLYDVILAADCLFFEDSRADLLRLMFSLLNPDGNVLIMAPKRGDTLVKFMNEARSLGFVCNMHQKYDDVVWNIHLKFIKERKNYNEDLDYPVFLILSRRPHCRILRSKSAWAGCVVE